MPHTKQAHIYMKQFLSPRCVHKHSQRAHLWMYITMETRSSYVLPKNMNLCTLLNLGQQKNHGCYTWILIHNSALYMHTCITCKHVCTRTCVCDCSDSLIKALQGLKHWSFKNDYWNFPSAQCFCWLIYRKKNQCVCNCRTINVALYWVPYS